MLEIYNEHIFDLLTYDSIKKMDIRMNTEGAYVPGLTQVSVVNLDEVNTVPVLLSYCSDDYF